MNIFKKLFRKKEKKIELNKTINKRNKTKLIEYKTYNSTISIGTKQNK